MEEKFDLLQLLKEIEEDKGEEPVTASLSQENIHQLFLKQRKNRSSESENNS